MNRTEEFQIIIEIIARGYVSALGSVNENSFNLVSIEPLYEFIKFSWIPHKFHQSQNNLTSTLVA